MSKGGNIPRCHSVATLTAAAAIVAAATAGCSSNSLRDSIAKGNSSANAVTLAAFRSGVDKLPPLKSLAESPDVQNFAKRHPSGCDCSFALPHENEQTPIAPLGRDALIGNWTATYNAFERVYARGRTENTKYYVTKGEERYSFRADGTYKMSLLANGKPNREATGRWTYSNGILDLATTADLNCHVEYRVDWFGRDDIAIRCKSNESGANLVLASLASKYPETQFKNNCKFWYDSTGCQRILREHVSDRLAIHGDAIETPHRFSRARAKSANALSAASAKPYSIIRCERENGSDFAYRFVLKLADGADTGLNAFRVVQQDFRAAVSADYAEAFALDSPDGLYVDFPEFSLRDGMIEGRAVVLTIKITSLVYNPQTRKGVLAVKASANQFEEARLFVRRNIETLARDKNIALVTGEIPEKARFYLGREEIKDGNILEMEFMTE